MSEHRSERVIEAEARPGWGRLPVAAVVVVGFLLAAVVGMTSAASPWVAGDGGRLVAAARSSARCSRLPWPPASASCWALLWVSTPRRTQARKKPGAIATDEIRSSLRAGSLVLIGGILVVAALLLAFWFLLGQVDQSSAPPPTATTARRRRCRCLRPAPRPPAPPVFDWFLFGLAASIAVIVPLALIARRRLRATDDLVPDEDDVPESVVRAVGESIDQIERDPDARRAIIRAYAQMEHAFDDAGMPRRPYEAPFEYLGRALRGVRVSPPAAGRLAALFERARFSQHVVDAETKDDAIGALREIERQMQAPSP